MEIISIVAILLSPIIAVLITLWYQSYKTKRDAKMNLFLTLMTYRKTNPPTYSMVDSLNMISVLFSKNKTVVELWHEYYELLCQKFDETNYETRSHKYLDMLSEMARVLGYKNLPQTSIDKFYSPVAHGIQYELSQKLHHEFLRVLENTASIVVNPKELKDEDVIIEKQNPVQK